MTIISGLPDDTVQATAIVIGVDEVKVYIAAAYYVNGNGAPHYKLPALREDMFNDCSPRNQGGVKGDVLLVNQTWYVDWSRGTLEVY